MSKKRWDEDFGIPLEGDEKRAASEPWTPSRFLRELPLARSSPESSAVQIPRLEEIDVTVRAPRRITREDLWNKFVGEVWAKVPRRQRETGEALEEGDEIHFDFQGHVGRRLIPNTLRLDMSAPLSQASLTRSYFRGLVGCAVGGAVHIPTVLSLAFPLEGLRGKEATYVVDVTTAFEVTMPDLDDENLVMSEEFLQFLGKGDSFQEVLEELSDELDAERFGTAWTEAYSEILDILVARSALEVSAVAIEAEIAEWWNRTEGEAMGRKGFSEFERHAALAAWYSHSYFRREAERRLKASAIVDAIGQLDGVAVTPKTVEEAIIHPSMPEDEADGVREMLSEEPELLEGIADAMRPLVVLKYLTEKVNLTFSDPE